MSNFKLKATHAPVKEYNATLEKCAAAKFDNEGNVRRAFEGLLEKCARAFDKLGAAPGPCQLSLRRWMGFCIPKRNGDSSYLQRNHLPKDAVVGIVTEEANRTRG